MRVGVLLSTVLYIQKLNKSIEAKFCEIFDIYFRGIFGIENP